MLAFYNYGATTTGVFVFKANSSGQLEYPKKIFQSANWDWSRTKLIAGKNTGKGYENVVAPYDYGNAKTGLWLFSLDANGNLIYPTRVFQSSYWDATRSNFLMSDLDSDGKDDVVAFYNYGGSHTGAHLFSSTGTSFAYPNWSTIHISGFEQEHLSRRRFQHGREERDHGDVQLSKRADRSILLRSKRRQARQLRP